MSKKGRKIKWLANDYMCEQLLCKMSPIISRKLHLCSYTGKFEVLFIHIIWVKQCLSSYLDCISSILITRDHYKIDENLIILQHDTYLMILIAIHHFKSCSKSNNPCYIIVLQYRTHLLFEKTRFKVKSLIFFLKISYNIHLS